jgi:hypothetical protein
MATGAVDRAPLGRQDVFARYPARWAGLKDCAPLALSGRRIRFGVFSSPGAKGQQSVVGTVSGKEKYVWN